MEKDHRETYQKAVFGEPGEQIVRTDPEFVGIIADFSQSEVPKASRLTEKERQLCILSVLLGCQGLGEFRNILHTALENGLEPVAVKEVIYQAAAYLGLGRIYDFLIAANQIMEQYGILLPLPKQGTTDKKNRFLIWRGNGRAPEERACSAPEYQPVAGRQLFWRLLYPFRSE